MNKSPEYQKCSDRISGFGKKAAIHVRMVAQHYGDKEAALWFARTIGKVIADAPITQQEKEYLVGCCYGQYVIATSLRPAIDNKPFASTIYGVIAAPIVVAIAHDQENE